MGVGEDLSKQQVNGMQGWGRIPSHARTLWYAWHASGAATHAPGERKDTVHQNLQRLIELGQWRPALELTAAGSYQVEASDEGLMTADIEACLRQDLTALRRCDLTAAEVHAWCAAMIQSDRVGFICDQELRALQPVRTTLPTTKSNRLIGSIFKPAPTNPCFCASTRALVRCDAPSCSNGPSWTRTSDQQIMSPLL